MLAALRRLTRRVTRPRAPLPEPRPPMPTPLPADLRRHPDRYLALASERQGTLHVTKYTWHIALTMAGSAGGYRPRTGTAYDPAAHSGAGKPRVHGALFALDYAIPGGDIRDLADALRHAVHRFQTEARGDGECTLLRQLFSCDDRRLHYGDNGAAAYQGMPFQEARTYVGPDWEQEFLLFAAWLQDAGAVTPRAVQEAADA